MDDQARVGVRHAVQHLKEQLKARLGRQPPSIAVGVDPLPLDVLEHQIRLAGGVYTGVEQTGDAWMAESRERGAFASEARASCRIEQRQVEQLDRGDAVITSIAAPSHPDRPHSAAPERALEGIASELRVSQRVGWYRRHLRGNLQKPLKIQPLLSDDHCFQPGCPCRLHASELREPLGAIRGRQVERLIYECEKCRQVGFVRHLFSPVAADGRERPCATPTLPVGAASASHTHGCAASLSEVPHCSQRGSRRRRMTANLWAERRVHSSGFEKLLAARFRWAYVGAAQQCVDGGRGLHAPGAEWSGLHFIGSAGPGSRNSTEEAMSESRDRACVPVLAHAWQFMVIAGMVFSSVPAMAQERFDLQIDHSTILVSDLEESAAFYENVLGLTEIGTPWGAAAPIRFYSLGGNRQLHVGLANRTIEPDKNLHLAFAVADFDVYLAFLRERRIAYTNFAGTAGEPQVRPDGVRQVYLQDPDGNWIEINDARHPPGS